MQRFKLIFHISYVIISLAIMYFSIDILLNTEAYLSQIKLSSYIKFPRYIMGLFLIVSILMIIEYVMQQLKIRKLKSDLSALQDETKALKARLYDKSQVEEEQSLPQESNEYEEDTE